MSGAQKHEVKLLEATLDDTVMERPSGKMATRQHLCGDKAYVGILAEETIREKGYIPHIRQRGEEIMVYGTGIWDVVSELT